MNWEYLALFPVVTLAVMAGNLLTKEVVDYRNRRQWVRLEEQARLEAMRIHAASEYAAQQARKQVN